MVNGLSFELMKIVNFCEEKWRKRRLFPIIFWFWFIFTEQLIIHDLIILFSFQIRNFTFNKVIARLFIHFSMIMKNSILFYAFGIDTVSPER